MQFAIVCASGIGDGLLMQIAAHHLRRLGHSATVFSNPLIALKSWFPGFEFAKQPTLEQIEELLAPFDAILLQHDNTPKAKKIRSLPKPVYTLYGSHLLSKHGPLRPNLDAKFDASICMAENIRNSMQALFPEIEATLENGLVPPPGLIFRKHLKRIAIHPTSTSIEKNWPKASFLKLKRRLEMAGWDPVFTVPIEEAADWNSPGFPTLGDLAAFLYESGFLIGNDSGPGHLASNLGLSTVIIGPSEEHLAFWRPGWQKGAILTPPRWVNLTKLTRRNWKYFITVIGAYKQFIELTETK